MKYCPQCGAPNSDAAYFCAKCGKILNEQAQSQPVAPVGTIPSMGFGDAIRVCLKEKYSSFSGRAKRSEYWFFYLFTSLLSFAVIILSAMFGAIVGGGDEDSIYGVMLIFLLITAFALFLPMLSVAVRRLHDTGRSGYWLFLSFVPYVGGIVLFIFYLLPSKPEDNEYGPYQVHAN